MGTLPRGETSGGLKVLSGEEAWVEKRLWSRTRRDCLGGR